MKLANCFNHDMGSDLLSEVWILKWMLVDCEKESFCLATAPAKQGSKESEHVGWLFGREPWREILQCSILFCFFQNEYML